MNYNNLAQKTNYLCGSNELEFGPVYLQSFSIPGMSFSHPELGGSRFGSKLHMQGDSVSYSDLSFTLLIDENFKVYHEFFDKVMQGFNPECDKFANAEFNFWIIVTNNKGTPIFRVDFTSCRISSLGDIELATNDDSTFNTLSVTLNFDFYKVSKLNSKEQIEKFLNS
jgi:hypothetical protein